jgi:hypothetical protein
MIAPFMARTRRTLEYNDRPLSDVTGSLATPVAALTYTRTAGLRIPIL